MNDSLLSPEDALAIIRNQANQFAVIDVRSESEFAQGSFPRVQNLPILSDEHRHQVGLCFRAQGQDAAIALGHKLVDPIRAAKVALWGATIAASPSQRGILFCWRGGLRSQIASQWIRASGASVTVVQGGYKAMRQLCRHRLEHFPPLLVIGGMTGSGKTLLLRSFPQCCLDLEGLAQHRGSAFGALMMPAQPTQLNFENAIALQCDGSMPVTLVEDESRTIGTCVLPGRLYDIMATSPAILVQEDLETRTQNIYEEYVLGSQNAGYTADAAAAAFLMPIVRISRRLGGALSVKVQDCISKAFAAGFAARAAHQEWIAILLTEYYDRQYRFALAKKDRPVLCEGTRMMCQAWLQDYLRNVDGKSLR